MPRIPGHVSEDTRQKLIEAGRAEFAEYGYQASSLRRICSLAGVTTGALYFFFKDKNDLFYSVISKVTDPFMNTIKAHYAGEENHPERSQEDDMKADLDATYRMLDFYYDNKTEWGIVLKNLDHTLVREFFESFIEISIEHYAHTISEMEKIKPLKNKVDRLSLYQFVHMQLDLILTLAGKNLEREEMAYHAMIATKMLKGAFLALVNG